MVSARLTLDGLVRVTLHAGGRSFPDVIVDTGSALTWLPASRRRGAVLRLAGSGSGICEPAAGNFSHRYADGSGASGVRCLARLRLAGVEWQQVIGAATSVTEPEALREAGLSLAGGVLALSPAEGSSFGALLQMLPQHGKRLSFCMPRAVSGRYGRLVLGRPCAPTTTPLPPSPPPLAVQVPEGGGRVTHWRLAASAVLFAMHSTLAGNARRCQEELLTPVRRLQRTGAIASVHIDSGSSHIVAEAALAPEVSRASRSTSSLALTLRSSPVSNSTHNQPVRPPLAPLPVDPPPQPLLIPLSYGCQPPAADRLDCALRTITASLTRLRAPRWILGVPLFRHADVTFEVLTARRKGGSRYAISIMAPPRRVWQNCIPCTTRAL